MALVVTMDLIITGTTHSTILIIITILIITTTITVRGDIAITILIAIMDTAATTILIIMIIMDTGMDTIMVTTRTMEARDTMVIHPITVIINHTTAMEKDQPIIHVQEEQVLPDLSAEEIARLDHRLKEGLM